MGNLSAFLKQNAVKADNVKVVTSKRFVDENKKPIEWEICAITSDEDEAIREECTKRIPMPGKKGQYTRETNYSKYLGKLAAKCTKFPKLDDKELQDSYKVMGSDELLKAMLTAGEYANYIEEVQKINGFDIGMDDTVEEAKN